MARLYDIANEFLNTYGEHYGEIDSSERLQRFLNRFEGRNIDLIARFVNPHLLAGIARNESDWGTTSTNIFQIKNSLVNDLFRFYPDEMEAFVDEYDSVLPTTDKDGKTLEPIERVKAFLENPGNSSASREAVLALGVVGVARKAQNTAYALRANIDGQEVRLDSLLADDEFYQNLSDEERQQLEARFTTLVGDAWHNWDAEVAEHFTPASTSAHDIITALGEAVAHLNYSANNETHYIVPFTVAEMAQQDADLATAFIRNAGLPQNIWQNWVDAMVENRGYNPQIGDTAFSVFALRPFQPQLAQAPAEAQQPIQPEQTEAQPEVAQQPPQAVAQPVVAQAPEQQPEIAQQPEGTEEPITTFAALQQPAEEEEAESFFRPEPSDLLADLPVDTPTTTVLNPEPLPLDSQQTTQKIVKGRSLPGLVIDVLSGTNPIAMFGKFNELAEKAFGEPYKEARRGFISGATFGLADKVLPTDADKQSAAYQVGAFAGQVAGSTGIAFISAPLLSGALALTRIAPLLSKMPAIVRWGVEGFLQGVTFVGLHDLIATKEYDIGFNKFVALDFTSGEIARQALKTALQKLPLSPAVIQVLSSMADHLGGTAMADIAQKITGQGDPNLMADLAAAGLGGFLVENVRWFSAYKPTLKATKEFGNIVDAAEDAWQRYLKTQNPEDFAEAMVKVDAAYKAMALFEGKPLDEVIQESIVSHIQALQKKILQSQFPELNPEAIDYVVKNFGTDKFDPRELHNLMNKDVRTPEVPERADEQVARQTGEPVQTRPKQPPKTSEYTADDLLQAIKTDLARKSLPKTILQKIEEAVLRGDVQSLEDLKKIRGIGEKRFSILEEAARKVKESPERQAIKELPIDDSPRYPVEVKIGGKIVEIDVSDPLVAELLKIANARAAISSLKDDPVYKQIEELLNRTEEDYRSVLGLGKEEFTKVVDTIKENFEKAKAELENKLALPRTESELKQIQAEISERFMLDTRSAIERYIKGRRAQILAKLFVTPSERFQFFNKLANSIDPTLNTEEVKSPINLTRILADPQTKQLVDALGRLKEAEIPKLTLEEIRNDAEQLAKIGIPLETAEKLAFVAKQLPGGITAIRITLASIATKAKQLAQQVLKEKEELGKPRPSTVQQFRATLELLSAWTSSYKDLTYHLANALNAGRIIVGGDAKFLTDIEEGWVKDAIDQYLKTNGADDVEGAEKLAQEIAQAEKLSEVMDKAKKHKEIWQKLGRALVEFKMMNILSFNTAQANVIAQAFNTLFDSATAGFAGVVHLFKGNRALAKKEFAKFLGLIKGIGEAFVDPVVSRKELLQAALGLEKKPSFWKLLQYALFKPKEYVRIMRGLEFSSKLETEAWKPALDLGKLVDPNKPLLSGLLKAGDAALSYMRMISFGGILGGDRIFRDAYYKAELRAELERMKAAGEITETEAKILEEQTIKYRKAVVLFKALADKGLTTNEINARIEKILGDNPLKWPESVRRKVAQLDERAVAEAKRGTWQDEIENQTLKKLVRIINSNPALKFLVPFTHTPTRIFEKFIYATPFSKRLWLDLAGRNGAEAQARAAGTVLTAGLLYILGIALYKAGLLIPPARDEAEATAWRQAGIEPASIRIGDTFISFNRFDPFPAYIFTAISAFARLEDELRQYSTAEPEQREELLIRGFATFTSVLFKSILDKTYFMSLAQFADFVRGRNVETFAKSQITSFVPLRGVYRSIRYSDWFGINPFAVDNLEWYRKDGVSYPKLDVFGEPIELTPSFFGSRTSRLKRDDIVSLELARLYMVTGRRLSGFGKTAFGVPVDDELMFQLYSALRELNVKRALERIIRSQAYQRLPDDVKIEWLRRTYDRYKNAAKRKVLSDSNVVLKLKTEYNQLMQKLKNTSYTAIYEDLRAILDRLAGS
jgi:hypothetical protein